MNASLLLDWQLCRLGRSGTIAVAGSLALACAIAWLVIGNHERRASLEQRFDRSPGAQQFAKDSLELPAWREVLTREESRLPESPQVISVVRGAVASLEKSGVTIEALSSSTNRVMGTPYERVMLDVRLSGPASRSARAVSQVLAASPGWALESMVLERRGAGQVAVEATLTLLTRVPR